MKKKTFLYIFTILSLIVLVACGGGTSEGTDQAGTSSDDAKINVLTSFYPMYEFTREVAGDRANVDLMVESGQDAHSYEPSAQDIAKASESDVFVYSSEEMEYWVGDLLQNVDTENLIVARAADGMNPQDMEIGEDSEEHSHEGHDHSHEGHEHSHGEHGHNHEGHDHSHEEHDHSHEGHDHGEEGHSHGSTDPHIWLDLVHAQDQVDVIKDALIEADPEGEEVYTENAENFKSELQTLHESYVEAFEGAENRAFVVQHEAFGYIANRYDLEQISVGGLSTEIEADPSRIAEISDIVNEHDVPVIYFQSGANSDIAQTIAGETDAEPAPLYDLESRTEEMAEQDLDYLGAMRENLEQLKKSIN